ncbi:hypothetical protein TNCV_5017601 [Trichonephila clavipes]|nr:hypothetical protein TNCV_5017601 [Trichonephila clavipes]
MSTEVETGCTVQSPAYPATITSHQPMIVWLQNTRAGFCRLNSFWTSTCVRIRERNEVGRSGMLRTPLIRQQRGNFDRTFRSDESG